MKSVFLVEVHQCFRESLACVLDQEPDLQVIAQAGSLPEKHAQCIALEAADAVILGSGMAAEHEPQTIHKLHEEATPPVALLVLTTNADAALQAQLLEAGAERVLTKNASLQEVIAAVLALGLEPLTQPTPL
jgi:DNA-binding NarL/FixJ family response regulator